MSGGTGAPDIVRNIVEFTASVQPSNIANVFLSIIIIVSGITFSRIIISEEGKVFAYRIINVLTKAITSSISSAIGINVKDDYDRRSDYDFILSQISKISHERISLSENVQNEIKDIFKESLDNSAGDYIKSELKLLINQQFKREIETESAKFFIDMTSRLKQASSTVTVRGFLNLFIGISFAISSLFILRDAIFIFTPEKLNSMSPAISFYLIAMRFSFSIIVAIISYFFLSLYKKSLEDTKYYQNEITNICSISVALNLAYYSGDTNLKIIIAKCLIESDRNSNKNLNESNKNDTDWILKSLVEKIPSFNAK